MSFPEKGIRQLARYIKDAGHIYFFTGAGISTDSGIPDFRGPDGLWKKRSPVYYQDFMSDEGSRIDYWEYKLEWWENSRDATPNAVHHAVCDLEKAGKVLMVVTQNIDGLHQSAGTSSEKIVELHGTNREVECQTCLTRTEPAPHFRLFKQTGKPPRCECGGFLKPATISFGQNLRQQDLDKARSVVGKADLVIALGSTLSVYPAASFPLEAAGRGAPYVIINRGRTDHDGLPEVSLKLDGALGDLFPESAAKGLL